MIKVYSHVEFSHNYMPHFKESEVKNEPMLFNCDLEHAKKLGGPITRAFLDRVDPKWHDCPVVVDTRVHMLMPGWYPCIPGWHHDDVPRTRRDGQPNYEDGQDRSEHCVALINGQICPTEYAVGIEDFPEVSGTVYAEWHPLVESLCNLGKLQRMQAWRDELVYFNDRTWHRGTAALQGGWRWFGRISRYFDAKGYTISRKNARTNEVRRQVQTYMSAINAGW